MVKPLSSRHTRNNAFTPTREQRSQVEVLSGIGVPHTAIASIIGIAAKTLRAHFRKELDSGMEKADAKVAANLFRIACGGGREAVTAACFWLRCRSGWSEYAPPHRALGKKGFAEYESKRAAAGTEWADLVDIGTDGKPN